MILLLSIVLFLLFTTLAIIHFYWAIGGKWGFANTLPTSRRGERVLNPRPADSIIVGLGLTAFSLFYLLQSSIISFSLPQWVFDYGGWIIPAIFILRAIGDFRYVGFFKKIQDTQFGKLDTAFYSPLCSFIGIAGFVIRLIA